MANGKSCKCEVRSCCCRAGRELLGHSVYAVVQYLIVAGGLEGPI